MPKLNEETPLVIIARTQVKEGKKEEYLKFGKEIDDAVNDTEPGMLFHDLGTLWEILLILDRVKG